MRTFIICLISGLPLFLRAQVRETPTITVMGDRFPMDMKASGRNIIVLYKEQIRAMPITSTDELLRYIPGIELQARGPMGSQADIIIRGSTFSQVLVMIDGVRINDPLTGHFSGNIPLALQEIERVEVIKGSAATIYGPDAVGGAINFITVRNGVQSKKSDIGGQLLLGQYNYAGSQLGFQLQRTTYAFSGGMQLNQSDGQLLSYGGRGFFRNVTASSGYARSLAAGWKLALRTGYDYRHFNARYFYTRSAADRAVETTSNWFNLLSTDYNSIRKRVRMDLAYRRNTDEYRFNPAVLANEHTTHMLMLQVTGQWRFTPKLTLGYGTQQEFRRIYSTDRGNHQDYHAGVYGLINYRNVRYKLNLNGTLRLDYHRAYQTQVSPQLNIAWQPLRKLTLRSSGGRALRAPDYTEMYVSHNLPAPIGAGRNWGNPDLRNESAWNAELGADYDVFQYFRISSTGFFRQGRDIIDFALTNSSQIPDNAKLLPNTNYFYSQNIAGVNTLGAELELTGFKQLGPIGIQGNAGFTYIENSVPSGTLLNGKYILSQARQLMNAGIRLNSKWGNLSITGLYKLRNPDTAPALNASLKSAYTLWNAALDIQLYENSLFATLQVHNLFNERYTDILGAEMPGRWIMCGMKFRFTEFTGPSIGGK